MQSQIYYEPADTNNQGHSIFFLTVVLDLLGLMLYTSYHFTWLKTGTIAL